MDRTIGQQSISLRQLYFIYTSLSLLMPMFILLLCINVHLFLYGFLSTCSSVTEYDLNL